MPLAAEQSGRVEAVFADVGEPLDAEGRFAQLDTTFIRLELEELQVQQERLRTQIAFDEREALRYRALAEEKNTSASQLDALEQSLRDNRHALKALDVKRRIAEERLSRSLIRGAPGWQVTERAIEPGQWVSEGEVVGRAGDFSTLLVPFALTPDQLMALKSVGDDVEVQVTDLRRAARARIYRVSPGFDARTRKVAVELAVSEPLPEMRGGLRVRLALRLPEASGAVRVPAATLGTSYEEHWVRRQDGERLPVLMLGEDPFHEGELRVVGPDLAPGDALSTRPEP
ncbi:efflux RND transporter periplasmic adaptor subunit [Thiorhodococcus minor]|uniref:HlyD family efflux transporter periplasmic adaptor subunit n=1 Tax=Thiorhodococcus minor TaxID=57489 RepID=A0A6M0K0R6_9GAMM|nr:HlyD family efflux transporter periplasmic adaptor subunit [Thiorhodococcus minor]NEV63368.1 HlyD family efflux transporter periplasmic adaptor subunit [Thiorhodococcus minor]